MKSSLIQRRVLVTGAAGCIGSHLTRRLAGCGYVVTALVRSTAGARHLAGLAGVELCEGDITDPRRIDQLMPGIDQIFHLAACVHAPPDTPESLFIRVNLDGTRNLVESAIRHRVRVFVHFSTVAVHAESDLTIDEQGPIAPATPYARSKYASERLVLALRGSVEPRPVVLRLPVVYGRGDRGNVARLIAAIRRHRYLIIGDGHNRKSMVAAANVADAAMLAAEDDRSRGRTYIVTDARPYTQLEIATTIAELLGERRRFLHLPRSVALAAGSAADILSRLTGHPLPLTRDRVKKLAGNTCYSGELIGQELGFRPRLNLRDGLREVMA